MISRMIPRPIRTALRAWRLVAMVTSPIGNFRTEGDAIIQILRRDLSGTMFAACLVAAGTMVAAPSVYAQNDNRTTTVTDRARPELDPLGVRAGGFIIFPNASITESFDDNIFSGDTSTVDDFITNIVPEIVVKSDWQSHEIKMFGSADIAFHADRSNENYEDFNLGAEARLNVLRDVQVSAGLVYADLHESRGSPDDVDGNEPTGLERSNATLGFAARTNRLSLSVGGELTRFDYDDATSAAGAVIDNDDRDRDRYDLVVRGGYEIAPEYEGFVRVGLSTTDYNDAVDSDGVNRDSDGVEIVAGARIDVTGVVFGDVFAGYLTRDYDDSVLATIDGVTAGVDMTWNVTKLTTLGFGVARTIAETTQTGASGYFQSNFDASVDHELLRNLILGARASLSYQDYEGIDRDDEVANFAVSGKYLLSRNFYISLGYDYSQRESDAAGADYDKNVVMLRLKGQL